MKTKSNNILKTGRRLFLGAVMLAGLSIVSTTAGCSKSESYSDLLKEEEKAVNWFLAGNRVENEVPEDGNFLTGPEAPYYRMDKDGNVYMQVLDKGEGEVKSGDKVYFFYERWNIKIMRQLGIAQSETNKMNGTLSSYYFFMGDTSSGNGALFGAGMQLPLEYLGYHSEVNLVLKSYQGFSIDQSECVPYLVNVKYLKPEY